MTKTITQLEAELEARGVVAFATAREKRLWVTTARTDKGVTALGKGETLLKAFIDLDQCFRNLEALALSR